MPALRIACLPVVTAVALLAMALTAPRPAGAVGAIVIHPDDHVSCQFDPGDVPGVDVAFPAECLLVVTPSGPVQVVARGRLPEGYTLSETFVGSVACGDQVGHVVATPSGEVIATCHVAV
jgi:hypothetical protein